MNNVELISPHISPRILGNIASLYNDTNRVFMEYIDNSIDSAENFLNQDDEIYSKPIDIKVEYSGSNYRNGKIIITDNCTGMDSDGLLRIIREIGNSDKKEQPWTNGQFGYGIYSFMAICKDIEIISKIENNSPQIVKLNRDILNTDHIEDVKIVPPKECERHLFEYKSGTKVTLTNIINTYWKDVDLSKLQLEIEKHFELLLSRTNINVSLISNGNPFARCGSFNYDSFAGEIYSDFLNELRVSGRRGAIKTFNIVNPLKVFIKITDGEDINKRPVIITKGRRIAEIKDLRSFKSENKQVIWNHPNVTGYIDIQDFLDPTIARNDFRNNDKSKALFSYLIEIESLIQDLIEKINKDDEERHYHHLENELNKALSSLAKLDTKILKYRTDIITGNEIPLTDGASGQELIEGFGGKDRNEGEGGSGNGIGENEGEGLGPDGESGNIPADNSPGDSPKKQESENPFEDSDSKGRKTRKSGFNVRIVDRPPNKIKSPRTGEIIEQRSILSGDTIEIFKQHPDFQHRIRKSRTKSHKIGQRMVTYLSGEMTVHYKDMFHNKMGQPEYDKWMFVDLTDSIYQLEKMLSPLVGANLSDLGENE